MDNEQIERVLQADPYTRPILQAVCPKNKIPWPHTDPAAYVINLDPAGYPGSHWIGVFIDKKHNESNYFDSMGQTPIPACIPLLRLCANVRFNPHMLQDHSMVCGQFVIMFLLMRARGYTFKETLQKLSHPDNDQIMFALFFPMFPELPFYPSGALYL